MSLYTGAFEDKFDRWKAWKNSAFSGMRKGKDNDNGDSEACCNLVLLVVTIMKIIVVFSSSFLIFDACNVGYMYEYLYPSLFINIVWVAIPCVSALCLMAAVSVDSICMFATLNCFFAVAGFLCAIAQIILLARLYDQYPQDTLLFYNNFYESPVHPLNCTQEKDLVYVNLGVGIVKYDAFVLMVGALFTAVCFLCGLGHAYCMDKCLDSKNEEDTAEEYLETNVTSILQKA